MTELDCYTIDAFTDRVFHGNPAAVIPLEHTLEDAQMQAIAMENNLSETAFFLPQGDDFHLRWFTPGTEVKLCGHATLATAHLLFTELGHTSEQITFHTLSGPLTVERLPRGYRMRFPRRDPQPATLDPYLCAAMGSKPEEQWQAGEDTLLLYSDKQQLDALQPDFARLAEVRTRGIIATAPGDDDYDFYSRFFAPAVGVNEDPVTGSAHCALTPFWATRLEQTTLHAMQRSARQGWLHCTLLDDAVLLEGQAVLYARSRLQLPF